MCSDSKRTLGGDPTYKWVCWGWFEILDHLHSSNELVRIYRIVFVPGGNFERVLFHVVQNAKEVLEFLRSRLPKIGSA